MTLSTTGCEPEKIAQSPPTSPATNATSPSALTAGSTKSKKIAALSAIVVTRPPRVRVDAVDAGGTHSLERHETGRDRRADAEVEKAAAQPVDDERGRGRATARVQAEADSRACWQPKTTTPAESMVGSGPVNVGLSAPVSGTNARHGSADGPREDASTTPSRRPRERHRAVVTDRGATAQPSEGGRVGDRSSESRHRRSRSRGHPRPDSPRRQPSHRH